MIMNHILCIEDDLTMQALVKASLPAFVVHSVGTIAEAKALIRQRRYSALVIDIQLPDGDGLRFATDVRSDENFDETPLFILSGQDQIANKVMAFTFGAEDFIAKPFDPIEFRARIESKIKRKQSREESLKVRRIGDLFLDFDRQKAFCVHQQTEVDLQLTNLELKILSLLSRRLEQVFSRQQIMDFAWGDTHISDRTVDSHVAHLRKKMAQTQIKIEAVKNVGYRACLDTNDRDGFDEKIF